MNATSIRAIGFIVGLVCVLPAAGQTFYVCKSPQGVPYRSAAPCPSTKPPPFVYYGPAQQAPTGSTYYVPRLTKPAEELPYMSPRCATMLEGIRTGSARGVNPQTQSDLRQEFEQVCRDDQRQAQVALQQNKDAHRRGLELSRERQQNQTLTSQREQQQLMSQCAEMRQAIASRKSRLNQTEGERQDLALFESRYLQRCAQKAPTP